MRQDINNLRVVAFDFPFTISILPERYGNNPVLVALFPLDSGVSEAIRCVGGFHLRHQHRLIHALQSAHDLIRILCLSVCSCWDNAGWLPCKRDPGGHRLCRKLLRGGQIRNQRHGNAIGQAKGLPIVSLRQDHVHGETGAAGMQQTGQTICRSSLLRSIVFQRRLQRHFRNCLESKF